MKLPTKPITKAFITVAGDRAVGISDAGFEMELYFDPNVIAKSQVKETIAEMRATIKVAYAALQGESTKNVSVYFDYEVR